MPWSILGTLHGASNLHTIFGGESAIQSAQNYDAATSAAQQAAVALYASAGSQNSLAQQAFVQSNGLGYQQSSLLDCEIDLDYLSARGFNPVITFEPFDLWNDTHVHRWSKCEAEREVRCWERHESFMPSGYPAEIIAER